MGSDTERRAMTYESLQEQKECRCFCEAQRAKQHGDLGRTLDRSKCFYVVLDGSKS